MIIDNNNSDDHGHPLHLLPMYVTDAILNHHSPSGSLSTSGLSEGVRRIKSPDPYGLPIRIPILQIRELRLQEVDKMNLPRLWWVGMVSEAGSLTPKLTQVGLFLFCPCVSLGSDHIWEGCPKFEAEPSTVRLGCNSSGFSPLTPPAITRL